jgi:hypothetical protein
MGETVDPGQEKARAIEEGESDYDEIYFNESENDDLIKFSSGSQVYWGRVEDEVLTVRINHKHMDEDGDVVDRETEVFHFGADVNTRDGEA